MSGLLHIVGARPNFPKMAPVYQALAARQARQRIVHTGQHYDDALSSSFFDRLGVPTPEFNLEVGSASHAVQTARVMERLEPILLAERPDWVVVYGDVNSTVAAALVAAKLGIRVAHVEAGLRSGDRSMPEETNRIVTDRLSDLLLTPSRDADETLRAEGEPEHEIVFIGNVMIDTLLGSRARARASGFAASIGVSASPVVVTLHRPSNVDDAARLTALIEALEAIAERHPVIFPAHPRTRARLEALGCMPRRLQMLAPLDYLEMLDLVDRAHVVITDSGGLQEETTVLGVPCLTVRPNTERPITIVAGTNRLVPDPAELTAAVASVRRPATPPTIEGWDGGAGERAADALFARMER